MVVYYWILRFVASLVVELVSLGLASYCGWWLLVVNDVVCLVLAGFCCWVWFWFASGVGYALVIVG